MRNEKHSNYVDASQLPIRPAKQEKALYKGCNNTSRRSRAIAQLDNCPIDQIGREVFFYLSSISNTMQSFEQLAASLLQEMLPPTQGNGPIGGRTSPGVRPKLQFSEDDLMDPAMAALLKQAKGDPNILAKMRPKIVQTLRQRRMNYMKQMQSELKTLS